MGADNEARYACLCCGFFTLQEPTPGSYAICPVCFWEDDAVQGNDPHLAGGANLPSLRQAREAFQLFGVAEERFLGRVRSPIPEEYPTAGFRNLTSAEAEPPDARQSRPTTDSPQKGFDDECGRSDFSVSWTILTQPVWPWITILRGTPRDVHGFTWRCTQKGLTARKLRGSKMRCETALFDEIGAALQFPEYFGANWPALADCITDLEWLQADSGYVLVITDADQVLIEEAPSQVEVLARILCNAANIWADAVDSGDVWDRPPVPFHVVLQVGGDGESIRAKWALDSVGPRG